MSDLVLSCEHGGNEVPAAWRARLIAGGDLLASHRGLDIGALELSCEIAAAFAAPLVAATTTRLLIDLNREEGSRTMFAPEAFRLDEADRKRLLEDEWRPHHERVRRMIEEPLRAGRELVYLSVHSFTPVWEGREREVDVGLLVDPQRTIDVAFVERFQRALAARAPMLRVAVNRPYSGLEEGIDRSMRGLFESEPCVILTLEVNQRFPQGPDAAWRELRQTLIAALRESLAS